ncbi:Homeodomain-like DNA binding domain-containing transcription factor [Phycomyces blakesleeanus NRRL 1555(-)]|uniref:Homeodomain-like DNA binding domain-containing transcription factor n=1 Tax=Phycomyces blakesleeanus (strain ATCC 8743b / DSM 1359 / FGSC 10004 / NBRC 33097 / NRRL 1555) TaxID=763407 RepID=A0A162TEX3_PHYB8|nr:Homeodomain-like DNA binding domain-containing transcription factor [Phycomyces blakesleeanus NRRL 1555(-)]OAD68052.1 Homeodomain-like DNA binding domain-containing transcription factor [Phycomyces blakesleeanus NRRL 1555(-)]|eukprot:XP_018286092.1 Homeodomain-like DNA binding domain-containing transcription factor [Phycomyces blakesleeanus NRRL 1555(-)]
MPFAKLSHTYLVISEKDGHIDEKLFAIQTITSHTQFLIIKPPERYSNHVMHPVLDETNNKVDMDKCLSASAAVRQLDIHIRTVQKWVKCYYEDPESIFEKKRKRKSGRRRILGDKHKDSLLRYIDKYLSAALTKVVECLLQKFGDLNVSRNTVYNFTTIQYKLSIKQAELQPIQEMYDWVQKWQQTGLDFTTDCIFLDESTFHINLKRGIAWTKKRIPAIVTMPTTKFNATSILGAISTTGLINASLRAPNTETVTGHYLSFLKATLDERDKYPEMKGNYLAMDNALIHSSADIRKSIQSRGY